MPFFASLLVAVLATSPAFPAPDSAETVFDLAPAPPTMPAPKLGGYLQARSTAQEQVGLTSILNRARFSIDGSLPASFSYRVLFEMEAAAGAKSPSTPSLREGVVRWSRAPVALSAGQMKVPFTRAYLIPVPALETADLPAPVDSLAPKYDIGLLGEMALVPWGTLALGVFNGEGQNASVNRDSLVLAVARMTATPLPQVALGASFARDAADSSRWGLDGQLQQWGAMLRGEYLMRHRMGRAHDRDERGWYLLGTYRVIPRLQLFAEQDDLQRPQQGPARRVRVQTAGASLDLAPNRVTLLLEGCRRRTGLAQKRSDVVLAQVQVRF